MGTKALLRTGLLTLADQVFHSPSGGLLMVVLVVVFIGIRARDKT
ncbi:hypothetical protein [Streptomyces sp. NPDC093591]